MASLSLFTGHMGLVSDRPSMQRTETAAAAATPSPTEQTVNQQPSFNTVYTLAYRCHKSAADTWSAAASAAKPLIWMASQLVMLSVILADRAYRAAHILATLALKLVLILAYVVANNTALRAMEAWACERAERIRKRICFEIALALLGPGGNLLLIMLWPGWIVLAAAFSALWAFV